MLEAILFQNCLGLNGATLQNLLKLFGYLIEHPFELAKVSHKEFLVRSESKIRIIY